MRSHILKKAVVLDTPQVKAACVDKAGTPVSFREIIRAKASTTAFFKMWLLIPADLAFDLLGPVHFASD